MKRTERTRVRTALAADAATIAALHAASWRSAYRGSLSDAYLDTEVAAERAMVWQRRLAQPAERQYVLLDEEPAWGACLDNLHVRPGLTGQGLGSELLARSLRWVAAVEPRWPMHLWVLAANSAARRFYERHGGTLVEQAVKPMPDGSLPAVCRELWREPGRLAAAEG